MRVSYRYGTDGRRECKCSLPCVAKLQTNRSENLIYFLTMVTAVATFYIVLSLGSQDVMRFLEESK